MYREYIKVIEKMDPELRKDYLAHIKKLEDEHMGKEGKEKEIKIVKEMKIKIAEWDKLQE